MNELLDDYVPRFDEPGDWNDVLRRARRTRMPRWRLALAASVAVAALVVGPALGVLLTRDRPPHLPAAADKSNVVVILQPLTGRILVQAAPWKGHDGVCYLILFTRAGCVPRSQRSTAVVTPPLAGYTFDDRIVSGSAVTFGGKRVPLEVRHFPKLDVTFFFSRGRLPGFFREATLRDAGGRVVTHFRFKQH